MNKKTVRFVSFLVLVGFFLTLFPNITFANDAPLFFYDESQFVGPSSEEDMIFPITGAILGACCGVLVCPAFGSLGIVIGMLAGYGIADILTQATNMHTSYDRGSHTYCQAQEPFVEGIQSDRGDIVDPIVRKHERDRLYNNIKRELTSSRPNKEALAYYLKSMSQLD